MAKKVSSFRDGYKKEYLKKKTTYLRPTEELKKKTTKKLTKVKPKPGRVHK